MVDEIWYYAGDRSIDSSWYTKRAILAGIYNTTELVLLQDSSPDYEDTWNFLENRVHDATNMAHSAKQVRTQSASTLPERQLGLSGSTATFGSTRVLLNPHTQCSPKATGWLLVTEALPPCINSIPTIFLPSHIRL
ncbi:hypothetical protein chiPu_0022368 [Chiloscyllium punctatum]|uniref:Ubiquinone biosynthesis protein n=1 Tax=Chiloscyllium punctatum TaxID=137246 RepID=A0A401RK60_CHIPU|nr:hypothetical protein [Chiloscyllium punctatum]